MLTYTVNKSLWSFFYTLKFMVKLSIHKFPIWHIFYFPYFLITDNKLISLSLVLSLQFTHILLLLQCWLNIFQSHMVVSQSSFLIKLFNKVINCGKYRSNKTVLWRCWQLIHSNNTCNYHYHLNFKAIFPVGKSLYSWKYFLSFLKFLWLWQKMKKVTRTLLLYIFIRH